jgi:hypothetical protein
VFIGLGASIARWGFWFLIVYGWMWRELKPRGIAVFVVFWLAGFVSLSFLPSAPLGEALFTSFVALLDVALVLFVFKRDIRIFP